MEQETVEKAQKLAELTHENAILLKEVVKTHQMHREHLEAWKQNNQFQAKWIVELRDALRDIRLHTSCDYAFKVANKALGED